MSGVPGSASGVSASTAGISESDVEKPPSTGSRRSAGSSPTAPTSHPIPPRCRTRRLRRGRARGAPRAALFRLNPNLPDETLHDARCKLTRPEGRTTGQVGPERGTASDSGCEIVPAIVQFRFRGGWRLLELVFRKFDGKQGGIQFASCRYFVLQECKEVATVSDGLKKLPLPASSG